MAMHERLKPTANFGQELRADPEKHEAIPANVPVQLEMEKAFSQ